MALNDLNKSELLEKAKAAGKKNKWLGIGMGALVFILGIALFVKGDKDRAEATFEIGGEILTAVFEGENVTVISATAPVSVSVVSDSTVSATY